MSASRLRDTWADVLVGVRSQPARAGLSFMGIAVGMAALTVLLAVLGGLRERSRRLIQDLGVNVFAVTESRSSDETMQGRRLSDRHVAFLAANLPDHLVAGIRVFASASDALKGGFKIVATDPALWRIRGWSVPAGRFIDEGEIAHPERNVVATRAMSAKLGWKVGDTVVLRTTPFRLVGIVETGGDVLAGQEEGAGLALGEHAVFVPRTLVPCWQPPEEPPNSGLDAVFVKAPDAAPLAVSIRKARQLLAQPDYAVPSLSWITPALLVEKLTRLQSVIRLTVGSISILCLVLGGTTLMSLMLANVRDRIPEIGLRRAFGADSRDIGMLFLVEACAITLAAAAAGAMFAQLLLMLGRPNLPVPLAPGWDTLWVPVVTAVALGVAFSYWPARQAARISPAEALRNE